MRQIFLLVTLVLLMCFAPVSAERAACGWDNRIITMTRAQADVLYVEAGDAQALVQGARAALDEKECFESSF